MRKWVIGFLCVTGLAFGSVLEVTSANFGEIQQAKKPVILDVQASWCPQCRRMEPVLQEMSEKYGGKILFASLDVDSQDALVESYEIAFLPTILFLKPGQTIPFEKLVGFIEPQEFEAKISAFLKD